MIVKQILYFSSKMWRDFWKGQGIDVELLKGELMRDYNMGKAAHLTDEQMLETAEEFFLVIYRLNFNNGGSLNGAELLLNSVNPGNSENLSMNWVQFKDPLCYLCVCGTVVSSLSLTQEIVGSKIL